MAAAKKKKKKKTSRNVTCKIERNKKKKKGRKGEIHEERGLGDGSQTWSNQASHSVRGGARGKGRPLQRGLDSVPLQNEKKNRRSAEKLRIVRGGKFCSDLI